MDALEAKMDTLTRQQKIGLILKLIQHEAKRNTTDELRAFVCGMLGRLVDGMTDADFEKFCVVCRCNEPGCDCHVVAGHAVSFFKLLRQDVRKELLRRAQRLN